MQPKNNKTSKTPSPHMEFRQQRLRAIVQILAAQVISSQDQLTLAMRQLGFEVTQATLSRDLRDLRAEKKVMSDGETKYVVPNNPLVERRLLGIDSSISRVSIRAIDFCGPFAVVKTNPGFANAVAIDIDDRASDLILGTLAGDDTILVIPRETTTREQLHDFLFDVDNR